MNIFVLDPDHVHNARFHVNSHIVKMPTEAAQMLSTCCRLQGIDAGFQITHQNHPCTIWARQSLQNWEWLKEYALSLEEEWRFRYNHSSDKSHKSVDVIRSLPSPKLPEIGLTPFALCMPDHYKCNCPYESYRAFYRGDKAHLANWGRRAKPDWWTTKEHSHAAV